MFVSGAAARFDAPFRVLLQRLAGNSFQLKFLTFYNKETSLPKGYVADFCPIERKVTACRIEAVHSSRYLNLVRLERGPHVRNDRFCCSCGIALPGESFPYLTIDRESPAAIGVLEEKTNPGVSERNRDLIQLREQIERGGPVDPELKNALLKEQFAWLEKIAVGHWEGETKLDRFSLLFALSSAVFFFAGMAVVVQFVPEHRRLDAVGIGFGAGLLLLVLNAGIFFLAPRRALMKSVLPLTAFALRPLQPTLAELDVILAEMRDEGFRYATKVNSRHLLRIIQSQAQRDGLRITP